MKITNMRVNHLTNPLGFLLDNVIFSWISEDAKGQTQEYAQILISKTIDFSIENRLFDSGKQRDIDSLGYKVDIELSPRTRYYWKVKVWDNVGDFSESEVSYFETGKLDGNWDAKWITSSFDKEIHPLLRFKFYIPGKILSARAYACGLGLYELEVNGEKIGNEYLLPGFNSYDFYLQYQTYDITSYLVEGDNALGAMLGNGWYKGRFGFDGGYTELYGDKFAFICEIKITLEDGREICINSDDSWKCHASPVKSSGIYDGEIYDSNLHIENWSKYDCDENGWRNTELIDIDYKKLVERINLPIVIKEKVLPIRLIKTPKDEYVIDFGQIITGWVEFKSKECKNVQVKLQYSEVMQQDVFYNDNLRTAKAEMIYISNGKELVVRPHFTYYGFRYVKVEGIENINLDDFIACVVMSDIDQTGNIETSNHLINKLFENALWSQKDNFLDIPTDCPQRDERMGWTGDAQVFASTASFNMYTPAFFTKYLYDLKHEQEALNGSVPVVVPMIKPGEKSNNPLVNHNGSCAWGDVATILPWTLYEHYGDKSLLEKHYKIMTDWVDYIKREDDKSGSKRLWTTGFHLADWLALDNLDQESPLGGTDSYFVASAYYYYSTLLTSKASKVLGKDEDYKYYSNLANEIKKAIINEYFTSTGRIAVNTQTAMVISLFMNFIPDEFKIRIINDLRSKLEENNIHLNTGFVGTPYICRALSDNGSNDYAYTLLLNDTLPSWLYPVKMGATTIWERWNSILPDGSISGTGMNSLNHYAYGSIVDWMYRNMIGINPMEEYPGFRKVKLKPMLDYRIKYAKSQFNSPVGKYKVEWSIEDDGQLKFKIEIPFNATVYLTLPDVDMKNVILNEQLLKDINIKVNNDEIELPCGVWEFKYIPTKEYIKKYSINTSSLSQLLDNDKTKKILNENLECLLYLPRDKMGNKTIRELSYLPFIHISEKEMQIVEDLIKDIKIVAS